VKAFLATILGFSLLSAFVIVTDWLAIHAGNVLGPLMLVAIVAGIYSILKKIGCSNG
jgi:hypothetical protein